MKELHHKVNGLTIRTVIHLEDDLEPEEKQARKGHIYHLTHPDAGPRRSKAWKARNPDLARERQREYNRKWRKNNLESYQRAYRISNRRRSTRGRTRTQGQAGAKEAKAA